MADLKGKIAVVTGASRGIGKGIAIALGERGCTVYVTGRTVGDGERTIDTTAREVSEAGGEGRAIQCDHGDDDQIAALFERIGKEVDHIDILVNNVYKIPDPPAWGGGYWDHPIQIWDDQVGIGLRAHYVASWHAAALMFNSKNAAMINVSSPGGQVYHFSACYGAGKAGLDRLTERHGRRARTKGHPRDRPLPGIGRDRIHPRCSQRSRDGPVAGTDAPISRSNRGRSAGER